MFGKSNYPIMITVFLLLLFGAVVVSAGEVVSTPETKLVLHMNGNAADSSGTENHGVNNGSDCSTSGKFGSGCLFDGENDYIEVSNHPSYENENGTITFSFKTTLDGERQGIVSKDASRYGDGGQVSVRLEGDNSIRVTLGTKSRDEVLRSDRNSITPGKWHDVAVVFGESGFKLYIDGFLADGDSFTGGLVGNKEPFVIGASAHRSATESSSPREYYFKGVIDEVVLWSKGLTAPQVATLHDSEGPVGGDDTGDDDLGDTGDDTGGDDTGGDTGNDTGGDDTGGDTGGDETEEEDIIPDDEITVPTVRITSIADGETITTNDVVVDFKTLNWSVGGKGESHVHFHLGGGGEENYDFTDHFVFYNSPDNIVEYNFLSGETEFASWIDEDTLQFNNVSNGTYQLRAHLVTGLHQSAGNPGADLTITFTIDPNFVPLGDDTLDNTADDTGTDTGSGGGGGGGDGSGGSSGEGSSGSGSGGGSGSCVTDWECGEWSECTGVGSQAVQTRVCNKVLSYCWANPKEKPEESQECEMKVDVVEEGGIGSKIVESVIGAEKEYKVISTVLLIIIAASAYFILVANKNKKPVVSGTSADAKIESDSSKKS